MVRLNLQLALPVLGLSLGSTAPMMLITRWLISFVCLTPRSSVLIMSCTAMRHLSFILVRAGSSVLVIVRMETA